MSKRWSRFRFSRSNQLGVDGIYQAACDEAKGFATQLVDSLRTQSKRNIHPNQEMYFVNYVGEYAKRRVVEALEPLRADIGFYKEDTDMQEMSINTQIKLMQGGNPLQAPEDEMDAKMGALFDSVDPDFGSPSDREYQFMKLLHAAIDRHIGQAKGPQGRA